MGSDRDRHSQLFRWVSNSLQEQSRRTVLLEHSKPKLRRLRVQMSPRKQSPLYAFLFLPAFLEKQPLIAQNANYDAVVRYPPSDWGSAGLYRERNRARCNARSREAMAKKRGSAYRLLKTTDSDESYEQGSGNG
jgi:hypothetical protein